MLKVIGAIQIRLVYLMVEILQVQSISIRKVRLCSKCRRMVIVNFLNYKMMIMMIVIGTIDDYFNNLTKFHTQLHIIIKY